MTRKSASEIRYRSGFLDFSIEEAYDDGSFLFGLGEDIPMHIASSLESVLQRVEDAFAAGAKQVRVVTDHSWLWLPGALPKYDLPTGLTKTKSRRYAMVKPGVTTSEVEIPWSWNPMDLIAFAPGICCHENGCREERHRGRVDRRTVWSQ